MVIGQITLYITTTWPYVSVMIYNVLTQNTPASSKSVTRTAIEAFAITFSTNFFLYLFNAVSVRKVNSEILNLFYLDFVSCLYIDSIKFST
jgi:hypothetical protein